ncbi:MAG: hypothetical protein IKU01_04365 [Bacteroidales bacterium]|nr:hypothetical protein [Bacteroidales bacterium]
MKNILFIIAFTTLFSNNIAIAQTEGTGIPNELEITLQENIGSTDGFFSYSENYNIKRFSSSITPVLPYEHELIGKQSADSAVPTGSGLLILTSIGICYAARKKNRSK